MSLKPTIQELDTCLKDVVDWKRFALHLPGIDLEKINIIETNKQNDVEEQKITLYNKWLKVYPDASWDNVVKALEIVEENTIAKQLRDKYLTNLKDLSNEEISSPSPSSLPIISPSCHQSSVDGIHEVEISEEVVKELNTLHKSFVDLTCDVKTQVRNKVETKNMEMSSVTYSLQEERAFPIPSLQSVQTTDELFEVIHPHYNFLNCYLIVSIALRFLSGLIAQKATEYKDKVVQFMKTTKVRYLRNSLKQYNADHTIQPSSKIVVEIAVPDYWDKQNIWLVKMLVETLFPVKHLDELPWYDIVPGSVIMTFIALEHMTSSLIESSRKKTEFMRLIGVISLKIGDELVWQREDGDAVLSFEDSLICATLADNIEAAQFLVQYARVDINARNTNRALINATEKELGYISTLDTGYKLRSFHATFNCIQKNVERLATTTSSGNEEPGNLMPHDNFLNGRKLASMELPNEVSTKIKNYIEMVDGHKTLFPVQYIKSSLVSYFPTPFSGSIEVIICLHSVWSTCSVWYVEQLGQLIFTPTLFYQLQWFRVDRREESVRVCLLADGKIMNSLKECVSDNKSRTSMLGVISVQVDDIVLSTNDYSDDYSDGYTFNEAIELAKAKGNDEIYKLLQGIFLSPVDYKTFTLLADEYHFIPDPDSTPLMIACCNDNSKLVQLFLDHNADLNIQNRRGTTALMYSTGNAQIFEILMDHGADINKSVTFFNLNAMHFASIAGNAPVVKTLIAKNADLVNSSGQTPLEGASRYGHTSVVQGLLQAQADPNAINNEGWTALEVASRYGHTAVVKLLLQAHADPNIQDNEGHTALQVASRYGHTAVVEVLLQSKANPNIQDDDGGTALFYACSAIHTKVKNLLLEAGADPTLKREDGLTAEDVDLTYICISDFS